jgi:hypothetical protein
MYRITAGWAAGWTARWAAGWRRLLAHAEVLDRTAAVAPVLPMRYGVVLPSAEAVRREVLAPNHDAFAAALARLSGRAQYTVRARYAADEPLREVLATEPLVRDLHQRLHRPAGGPDHAGRMRLGELVARSVAARRERDTAALVDLLRPYAEAAVARISRALEGERVADASFLVDLGCSGEFESAVEDLGRRWRERIRLRLLGPMAAYHFVDELVAGGDGG